MGRNCTSAKVNCPYCPSVVRYDGIRAHVKIQHPDVDMPKGFTRNLSERIVKPRWQSRVKHGQSPMTGSPSDPRPDPRLDPRLDPSLVINQTGESCSCKYYNFVSFFINSGINIEKVKENINLLKSIDNLK